MSPDPAVRDALAAELLAALRDGSPGSCASLRGSLARGTADAYSDIDVAWTVAGAEFGASRARVPALLTGVRPLLSVRADPEFQGSPVRRLLFVCFAGLPLFWRLDLDVRAARAPDGDDSGARRGAAAGGAGWSLAASALANGVAAVKAVLREQPGTARGLLERGFARIAVPAAVTGEWRTDIHRLADAAALREPDQREQAERVRSLADTHLAAR
ncbi:hypothetical protein OG432_23895 [Streptomyces sp. NBC_00442]|uniref:hypothetical protein n=1 Tax=Streptomyces sp. NBC_00442 TaxID=2903651 RepID=UPI002E1B869A